MLNYIWAGMIIAAVVFGAATGRMEQVGNGAIESTKEAVGMCITMLGIMSMWMGFMNVAMKSGLIQKLESALQPFIKWLFPGLHKDHRANEPIVTNIIANILGLGWAATPAGLKAMEELAKDPVEQRGWKNDNGKIKKSKHEKCIFPQNIATDEMCTFLVLNISSLQIIPVNIIAYRSQYNSLNPAAIVVPAIIATSISTVTGIIFCKVMCAKGKS